MNIKHSGREDNERERERYRLEREREDRGGLDRRPDFRDRGERKCGQSYVIILIVKLYLY